MASITKDTTNHIWLFSDTITNSSYNVVFDTVNKFLDAKIKATLTVQNGTITPIFSQSNLGTYFDTGTVDSNSIIITPQATNTGGFITAHSSSDPVIGTAAYYTIKAGAGEANTANVVISSTDGSNAGVNISGIVGTVVDTEPTSGYYLSFTGSGSSKIKTTGWMTAGTTLTAASKTRYFPITKAVTDDNGGDVVVYSTDGSNAGVNISGIVGTKATTEPTSGYYLAFTGSGSSKVTTAGYLPLNEVTTTGSSVKYFPITKAVTGNNGGDVVISTTDGSNAGVNISAIVGTKATTEPTSGYYLAFTGSGSSKVTTAGYLPLNAVTTTGSSLKYFPVTAAVLAVSKTGGSITPTVSLSKSNTLTWSTTDTSGVSVTGAGNGSISNLSIKANVSTAGYIPTGDVATASSLSIAAASTAATETKYLTGVTITSGNSFAVTNSGTVTVTSGSTSSGKVTITAKKTSSDTSNTSADIITNGLWNQATIKSPDTTATLGNPTYISDSNNTNYGKFTITASGTIAKPTVSPAGYVNGNDTIGTRQTGAINGTKVLNKITVGTTISSGSSGKVTPVISRTPKPSDDTWTDAASGAATDTKPTSGVYVQVDAPKIDKTIGVQGTVTAEGYGTTSQYNKATAQSITAGSAAAATKYVPITTTSMTQNKVTTLKNNNTQIDTRANASWGTGWITSGTIDPATFANSASSDTTYIDISKTDAAPVLVSGDYLYINRGYVDNLKISLARLVPDSVTATNGFAPANYILAGYAAFDAAGEQITGTLQTYNGAYSVNVS